MEYGKIRKPCITAYLLRSKYYSLNAVRSQHAIQSVKFEDQYDNNCVAHFSSTYIQVGDDRTYEIEKL